MEAKYRLTFEGAAQRMLALFCVREVQNVHLKTNLQKERKKTLHIPLTRKSLTYFFCKSTFKIHVSRGLTGFFFFFLVQNIRMLKLHVNFILQAQNPHKRPSEVLVLQYIQHTVHHPWREHKPVLCHFQLHTPRSKCRFFSM